MTREDKEAIVRRLKAMYNEAEDNETKEALFYATEALQENESLARSVNEASELLRKKRPHGEWEFIGENLFMCTKCSYIADADYLRKWSVHTFDSEFPDFCPNCGSDNRPRKDGET